MPRNPVKFSNLLNYYVARAGYTQADLSRMLAISRAAISRWFAEIHRPKIDHLQELAKILHLNPDERRELLEAAGYEDLFAGSQSSLPQQALPQAISTTQRITPPLERPSRVRYFTGRKEEIDQILEALQLGQVITLVGPGGIGKSAIVAEVVHRLSPDRAPPDLFPDGIISHDFYRERQATILLEKIAQNFGEEPRPTPATAAQRILSKRKLLLILDGAENADDLNAVLAIRESCGVLITSRSRKDVVDLRYDVVPLPREDAIKVLQAWGGARITNHEIGEQICKLVGELPLAVRLAGRYMAEHEEDGADYLAWLKETPLAALDHGQHQHESIPWLLQRSLDQVSEAKKVIGAVGLLALAPFRPEVIAAALELSVKESTHLLGKLVRYSLLERPEGRYQVSHALVHTYAKWHLMVPDKVAIQLAIYYIHLAQEQSALRLEGYKVLEDERSHIMAALTECVERHNWEEAQSLAKAIDTYLDKRGHWSERVIANEAGLKAAQATKDKLAEGFWLGNLGVVCRRGGEVQRAIPFYEQALAIFRELHDRHGEAANLRRLASAYRFLGKDINIVLELHEQSLAIARAIANQGEEANNLSDLGIIYVDQGKKHLAITLYEQALAIFRELGDREGEGKVLGNLGVAYSNLGDIRHSILLYEQSQKIASEAGNQKEETDNLNDLGNAYAKLGDLQQAIPLYHQYLARVRELGDREGEGLALLNLGEAYTRQGEALGAIEYHEQSLAIVREIGDSSREAGNLNGLGRVYTILGDVQRAIIYGEQALVIARKIPDRDDEARALATLAAAYILLGEKEQAIGYYKQAIGIAREVANRYTETRWAWELGLFYEKLGDYKQAASLMAITVEYERAIGHTQSKLHARHLQAVRRKAA